MPTFQCPEGETPVHAEYEQHLDAIRWADFDTAYGAAVDVPRQLKMLAGSDRQAALDATHELWCGLCHQHVQVGSAALPALPFLLEVLDQADPQISIELLDILQGLALGVNRRRLEHYQRSIGREPPREESWRTELRAALLAEVPRFQKLVASADEDLAGYATTILEELGVTP
jgi:hypothetical protein